MLLVRTALSEEQPLYQYYDLEYYLCGKEV